MEYADVLPPGLGGNSEARRDNVAAFGDEPTAWPRASLGRSRHNGNRQGR